MKVIHVLAAVVLALSLTACDKKEAVQQTKREVVEQHKPVAHEPSVQGLQAQVAEVKRRGHSAKEREDTANELRKAGLPESEVQKAVSKLKP